METKTFKEVNRKVEGGGYTFTGRAGDLASQAKDILAEHTNARDPENTARKKTSWLSPPAWLWSLQLACFHTEHYWVCLESQYNPNR